MIPSILHFQSPDILRDLTNGALVHESTHALTLLKGEGFTQNWAGRFPKPRAPGVSDFDFLEETGLLSLYAATDYNATEYNLEAGGTPPKTPTQPCRFSKEFGDLRVDLHDLCDFDSVAEGLARAVFALPGELSYAVNHVVISSDLDCLAFCGAVPCPEQAISYWCRAVCEDIAVSAEYFYGAYREPHKCGRVLRKLVNNNLTRQRLSVLVEGGFFSSVFEHYLLEFAKALSQPTTQKMCVNL